MSVAKLHSAGDLLASIPALLGFVPHDSVVVVGLVRGRRLGLMIRLDHADCEVREVALELGSAIATHLVRDGAREAIVVSYIGELTAEPDAALDALVTALKRRIRVRDAWEVAGDRYRSQWCEDEHCCPRSGLRLPAPALGIAELAFRRDGDARNDPRSRQERADARRRVERARRRALAARSRGEAAWRSQRWREWQAAVSDALDGHMPPDAQAGRMLAGFDDSQVRDAIVVSLEGGASPIAQSLIDGSDSHGVRDVLERLISGCHGADSARIEAAIDLAMYLSRAACGPRVVRGCAGPLTVAAMGHWWLGDTHGAGHLLDAAIAAEPDYRLARLAAAAIAAGLRTPGDSEAGDGLGHLRP